jgi:hypothetical protein
MLQSRYHEIGTGSRLLANNRSISLVSRFHSTQSAKDYRAAKGSPRTAVSTESKTLSPWIFATSNGDRIAQILNLALRVGKRRPRRKTLVVRIA